MSDRAVVYDACVLYPAPLRSFLMYLALSGLYRARWTDEIHEEWIRSAIRDYPGFTREQAERIRGLMNAHVLDSLVTDYEDIVPTLTLPDANDRHVLAAAIHARAEVIVTFNLRDFPAEDVAPLGVAAVHPDAFIIGLFEQSPERVCLAAQRQRSSLKNPPLSVEQYLAALERQGLSETVARLRSRSELL